MASMTFVQLVEDLRIECGVSGSPIVSVQNLSGELARLKKWIADAWNEIQTSRDDWKFMRTGFSFVTTANIQNYTPTAAGASNFADWKQDSLWIYSTALGLSDQQPLAKMDWDWFRDMYIRGQQNAQRPMCYSIDPAMALWFGSLPDTTYNITGEYWTTPVQLSADADVPAMPARFHRVIVCEAMKKYAGFESAPEVYQRGVSEGSPLWSKLEKDQLPPVMVQGGFDGYSS